MTMVYLLYAQADCVHDQLVRVYSDKGRAAAKLSDIDQYEKRRPIEGPKNGVESHLDFLTFHFNF